MNFVTAAIEEGARIRAPYRPDLVAAAEAIAANLPARREETDRLCRLPASTVQELEDAHLFDILTPAVYGGQEASLQTLMDCVVALAKGDGAVGWTVSLLSGGSWAVSAFYEEGIAASLFSSAPNVRLAGALQPKSAKLKRTADGVVINSATWGFASGVHHANWVTLGLPIFDGDGLLVENLGALIPVSDIRILDDWNTVGLRGTGSNSVSASEIFVPNSMLYDIPAAMSGTLVSPKLENHALYRVPMVSLFATKLAFTALGIAKAIVDDFAESSMRRGITFTQYAKQSEAAVTHLQIGEATAKIECAELLLRKSLQELEQASFEEMPPSLYTRATVRRNAGYANQLIREAVEMLVNAAGSSFATADHPLNRLWRDARVASLHAGITPASSLELYGRVRLGLDPGTPMV